MRTNIVIDDSLLRSVLRATALKTKREAVEQGLLTLRRVSRPSQLRRFRRKLHWKAIWTR